MHSSRQNYTFLGLFIADKHKWHILILKSLSQYFYLSYLLYVVYQGTQFFQAIRKAIGKLNASNLIILEKIGKSQLVTTFLPILVFSICVRNACAAPSPLGDLLCVPVADLHALIEETGGFGEPPNDEMSFSLDPLDTEIEPT